MLSLSVIIPNGKNWKENSQLIMQSLFVRRWVVLFMKEKANKKEVTQTLTRSHVARLELWPLEHGVRARKAEGSGCWRSRKSLVLQMRKHNTFVLSLKRGICLGHRWGKPTVAGPPPFPLLLCIPTATKWYVLWVNLLVTIIFSSSGWSPALWGSNDLPAPVTEWAGNTNVHCRTQL